jgi:hypothetical protein
VTPPAPVGGSAHLVVIPATWLGFVFGARVTGVATLALVPGLVPSGRASPPPSER